MNSSKYQLDGFTISNDEEKYSKLYDIENEYSGGTIGFFEGVEEDKAKTEFFRLEKFFMDNIHKWKTMKNYESIIEFYDPASCMNNRAETCEETIRTYYINWIEEDKEWIDPTDNVEYANLFKKYMRDMCKLVDNLFILDGKKHDDDPGDFVAMCINSKDEFVLNLIKENFDENGNRIKKNISG